LFPAVWSKAYSEDEDRFIKKGQRILLSGSQMASACQLKSEGGLNSHRTQYGLIDCTGGGTEFYGTQNARIIIFISFCFCGEYH
jgi:hypothetical protein